MVSEFTPYMIGSTVALTALIAILLHVIVHDLRHYRILNRSIIALFAMFLLDSLLQNDWTEFKAHLMFGGLMIPVMLLVFGLGLMGGGDVKLLMVAFFWLGSGLILPFICAMFGILLVYVGGSRLKLFPAREGGGRMQIPFAPAIAGGWMLTALFPTLI
jgi:prepilin peptidase CpaA